MTALGLASGIAGSYAYQLEPLWRELSVGAIFGVVIGGYLCFLRLATPLKAAAFAVLTVLAWWAAERSAIHIFAALPGEASDFLSLNGLITGVAAGLEGALLLALAGALLFPFYRRLDLGLATAVTGGVFGALMTLLDLTDSALVLFAPWQAAIAFCLALGLPKDAPTSP